MPTSTAPSRRSKERLLRLLRERRRRRTAASLLAFVEATFPDYRAGWHHRLLCARLDAFARGLVKRLIVCMPPRHGKSQLVSRHLPAYLLGRNPDCSVIATSYSADLARRLNRDVQRIVDTPAYQEVFPQTRLSGRNVRTLAGVWMRNADLFEVVGRKGSYRCAGVGGGITGMGGDFLIIDDPVKNREEADSPVVREATWNWYTGVLYSRRAPGAGVLVCSTRWNEDDLVGRLLKLAADDPRADQWEVLRLPAVAEGELHPADPRGPGEALWPERYGLDDLARVRANSEYEWHALYQQDPHAPGGTEWPAHLFSGPGFWFDDWPSDNALAVKTMALDPSKGNDAKAGDYQALVSYGRAKDGTEYVEADLAHRPMTAPRGPGGVVVGEGMCELAVARAAAFRPAGFMLEANTFQGLLLVPLRIAAEAARVEVPWYTCDNTTPKPVRIRRLGEALSQRKIRFRRTPGTRLLVDQLRIFPLGEHDDGPDALEMARRLAIEIHNKHPRR